MALVRMAPGWATIPARHWEAAAWRSHGRTRAVVVTLVGLAYGLVLGLNIVSLLTGPRLSVALAVPAAGQARVIWVLPGGLLWVRGVRPGDRVLALDRHPPTQRDAGSWSDARLLVRTPAGVVVAVGADAMRQGHDSWPLLVLSPWFLLFGTLVMLRASQPVVGRATYALFASAAFALAVAPASDNNELGGTIAEHIVLFLFAACFVRFLLAFPVARGTTRLHTFLLLPPLGTIVLGLAALVWPVLYDAVDGLGFAILLAYLLLGTGLLVYSFVVTRECDTRRGLTVITMSAVTSVLPFAVLSLLPAVLGRCALVTAEHTVLALALLPAGFAYAILRHNMLNVHLLQRWLVQGVV